MQLTEATWREITEWFDRLAELSPQERERVLSGQRLDPEVLEWLERLLDAHDAPEPLVVDRTIDAVAAELTRADSTPPPADWAGTRIDAWFVKREIERGGMATVVLAERADGRYERQVALKVLHAAPSGPAYRSYLEREIQLLAGLSHPGIVHLIDGGISEQGWPYIAMEYVEGQPIDVWCARHRASLEQRVALLLQAAEAVAYAHEKLVVHSDLKPANVLVDERGRVRLVDFGIGRLLKSKAIEQSPVSSIARLRCSPAWAAPEQLRGEPASVATDVHGLGMLMHAVLAGQPPRNAEQATRLFIGGDWTEAPDEPSAHAEESGWRQALVGDLDAVCMRARAVDPDKRYRTVDAFARDLQAWQAHRPVTARDGGLGYRLGRFIRRNRLAASAGTAVMLALLCGTAVALWQADRAQRALEATSAALDRANRLNEFVIDLFDAAAPMQPRDQLPTTEALLELGARRAMDPETADGRERIGMLNTMARVYMLRNRNEAAAPLVDSALDIVPSLPPEDVALAVRAHFQAARVDLAERSIDDATAHIDAVERMLAESNNLVLGERERDALLREAEITRARIDLFAGAMSDVIERLEPLRESAEKRLGDRLSSELLSILGIAYRIAGRPEAARDVQQSLLRARENRYGTDSLYFAIAAANLANSLRDLGAFADSEALLRQALALYDRIFEQPSSFRAAARHSLARNLLNQGRFDQALEAMEASTDEWARATDREPQTYPTKPLNRAMLLARIGDWPAVERAAREAKRRFSRASAMNPEAERFADVLLVMAQCRQMTTPASSEPALERAAALTAREWETHEYHVQAHEALAACELARERARRALAAVDDASVPELPAGRTMLRTDLALLRSEALRALGRSEEARQLLLTTRDALRQLPLDDAHPALDRLGAALSALQGDAPADAVAAPTTSERND